MNAVICGQPVLEQAIMFSGMKEHNSRTYSNLSGTTVNRLYHCPAPEPVSYTHLTLPTTSRV